MKNCTFLGLRGLALCVEQTQMCAMCVAKKCFKKCGEKKNKTSLRWQVWSVVSPNKFVPLLKTLLLSRCIILSTAVIGFLLTVSGLAKVAIFTTNVDAENQFLINHKSVFGVLNRHFCQTRVSGCPFCQPNL